MHGLVKTKYSEIFTKKKKLINTHSNNVFRIMKKG